MFEANTKDIFLSIHRSWKASIYVQEAKIILVHPKSDIIIGLLLNCEFSILHLQNIHIFA